MRAIDRHEDSIVMVLGLMDLGASWEEALGDVGFMDGLTCERLTHLTKVWCALAGIPGPV